MTWQGVGWITRKLVHSATITLRIKQYKDDEGAERIDIETSITGGIKGPPENRTLDWTPRTVEQKPFGFITIRARRIPIADVTDEYLNSGWLPDVSRDGTVQTIAEPDKERNPYSWKSDMVRGLSP